MKIRSLVMAGGLLLAAQVGASAQVYDFSFVGFNRDNVPASFTFQETGMPTPIMSDTVTADVGFGLIENVMVNGVKFANSEIDFFTEANGGGFTLAAGTTTATQFAGFGFQLFSGTTANPVFSTEGIPLLSTEFLPPVPGVFTITPATAVSAVPEPGTWVMMLLGSGALALFGFARREKVGTAALIAA